MPSKNPDLHGNVPDSSAVTLVLIDMINDLEFEGGDMLLSYALPVARQIAALKRRAKAAGIPVIYANDNFGRWRSDFREVITHCLQDGVRGQPLVEQLRPEPDDYFVLKPKHSAFYASTLEMLLEHLGSTRLILTGISGNLCVLFTAADAYMRDFDLQVPADCIASISPEENQRVLAYLRRNLNVDTTHSQDIDLEQLQKSAGAKEKK